MSEPELLDLTVASHLVVESFLLSQGYAATAAQLRTDAAATGLTLPPASGTMPDLRTLIESYRSSVRSDERRRKEALLSTTHATRAVADPLTLTLPGPTTLRFELTRTHATLHAANMLSISRLQLPRRTFDTATAEYVDSLRTCLVTTAADRRIVFSDATTGEVQEILEHKAAHQAAVLCVVQDPIDPRCIVSAGMDAKVVVWDLLTRKPVQVLADHTKFVVRLAVSPTGDFLASIGYDKKLIVYRRIHRTTFTASSNTSRSEDEDENEDEQEDAELQGPRYEKVFEMETRQNPEAILFVRAALAPEATDADEIEAEVGEGVGAGGRQVLVREARQKRTWLCFTVRNDSFLHYLALPTTADASHDAVEALSNDLAGSHLEAQAARSVADWSVHSFNTNPDSADTHVSYSLLALSLHPSSLYICVQTGDHSSSSSSSTSYTAGSTSRLLLLPPLSPRRAATVWTGVATSAFALPRHSWLPSGRACWLNAQDGWLRLVDLKGKTRASVLSHGLVASTEPDGRDVATAWRRGANPIIKDLVVLSEHEVASCGFDRTARILTIPPSLLPA